MGGDLLVRMVSTMERYPRIGLLQTLTSGVPAVGAYPRFFIFYSRHTARIFYVGNTWWTDDCALYWGHNAIIRTKAFHKHCMLPILPGRPPLGGFMLSHDLVEAMFMRNRGGYEVRLIPSETESYETQPPTFIDSLRREVRWCQGSMQYFFLFKEPGLTLLTRFQVLHTIFQYLLLALCVVLLFASLARLLLGEKDETNDTGLDLHAISAILTAVPIQIGILYAASTSIKGHGGALRFAVSVALQIVLFMVEVPTLCVAIAVFLCNLLRGKAITWDPQNRDRLGLGWYATFCVFWPQTLLGVGIAGLFAFRGTMPPSWVLCVVAGLCLAVPFAVFTASPRVSRIVTRLGLFRVPEEVEITPLLWKLLPPEVRAAAQADATKKRD